MSVVGMDCRRTHCRGVVKVQQNLSGEKIFVCNGCGKEYTEHGASVQN